MYLAIRQWIAMTAVFFLAASAGIAQAGSFPAPTRQDQARIIAELQAARFLTHATFGPNQAAIQSLADEIEQLGHVPALEAWIDQQFALSPSWQETLAKQMIHDDGFVDANGETDFLADRISTRNYRYYSWWHTALTAPDQLRQRMAWALAQIFVINDHDGSFNSKALEAVGSEPQYMGVVNYYDMLLRNAFGNYRTVLGDVTLHPVMGVFLSHINNPKADPVKNTQPDENYARELQQLFSIGLYELKETGEVKVNKKTGEPIPSYDNEDIRNFARVFTGLGYYGTTFGRNQRNFHNPMIMHEHQHDTDSKTLHNGTVLPAGQSGLDDINAALDNLFQHPNTGPFIARLLIQRFVKSNPSKNYIRDVARAFADNGNGERGDFQAVLKAILLHSEALKPYQLRVNKKAKTVEVNGGGTEDSRLQEPVLRFTAFVRAFLDADPTDHRAGYLAIGDMSHWLNQNAYRAHHVFNFYLPNHVPPGELLTYRTSRQIPNHQLYAPEFEILTSVAANRLPNRLRADVLDAKLDLGARDAIENYSFDIFLDFDQQESLAGDPQSLLTHLNLLLCRGLLEDAARDELVTILAPGDALTRTRGAILALLTAPGCAVHE